MGALVAAAFDLSVHIRTDDFARFLVSGWIDPWRADSAHQNDVQGAAAAAAAIQFAVGGYTVVFDGHFFPEGIEGMVQMCQQRAVPVHYAVLRADLNTCLARAAQRGPGAGRFTFDAKRLTQLHARFADLGVYEAHTIEASRAAQEVAETVLTAFARGRLEAHPR